MVVAALLRDYPTPLVGYGGSAVLGYLLSVALLPNDARETGLDEALETRPADGPGSVPTDLELHAAGLALLR